MLERIEISILRDRATREMLNVIDNLKLSIEMVYFYKKGFMLSVYDNKEKNLYDIEETLSKSLCLDEEILVEDKGEVIIEFDIYYFLMDLLYEITKNRYRYRRNIQLDKDVEMITVELINSGFVIDKVYDEADLSSHLLPLEIG